MANSTRLQAALAKSRLADVQRRLAEDSADLTTDQAREPDHSTDVTDLDAAPVTIEDAREPDDNTEVNALDEVTARRKAYVAAQRRKNADSQDPTDPTAADPTAAPADASATPGDDSGPTTSSGDELADSLPIDWKQDESGQAYGTIQGTHLDIFVNDDKSWQVLPEGSNDPIAQGQAGSFDEALQQAFDAGSQIASEAGSPDAGAAPADPTAADPTAIPAPPVDDPTKPVTARRRKRADGETPEYAAADDRTDVEDLDDHPENIPDGTYSGTEFDHNAGDDLADPVDGSEVFNFQPGGAPFTENNKSASVRKTSAAKASELADLMQSLGLIESGRKAKYAAVASFEKTPAFITNDRLALLELVENTHGTKTASRTSERFVGASRIPSVARTASNGLTEDDLDSLVTLH